jgi:hypothetical protein
MNESDIVDCLKRAGVKKIDTHVKHAAWSAFVRAMRSKQYGPTPCLDAWLWFASGWDECDAQS